MATDPLDISQLTATQQEALQTYISFTDSEPSAAIPLLQRSEWNVQIAITRFFEGEPTSDPLAEAQAAAAAVPAPTSRQYANLQHDAILPTPPSSLRVSSPDTAHRIDTVSAHHVPTYRPPFLLSILLTPFNILYRVLSTVLSPLSFLTPSFVSRFISNFLSRSPRPNRRALPPGETAHRFIREFNEIYPTEDESALPWTETGYNLALDNAKDGQKFLIVVLISPSHDETHTFVTELLQSSQFREFLNSHRDEVILWGGNVQDAEAYQVSSLLACSKFPFAALICQTPDSPASTSASGGKMTVISRLTGTMAPPEFVTKLRTAMTNHQAALRAARTQRVEQQAQRNLRQEQDSAYERSLAQDRERARRRKEEEQRKADEEKEALKKQQEAERWQQRMHQWKRWRAQSLSQEPGADAKDAVRVSIRMPNGERVIRKFLPDADLEELYAFVECYSIVKGRETGEIDVEDEKDVEEPEGYEHEYKFQLVSPMPRAVFSLSGGGSVIDRVGRGANLMVETIAGDEEDEEDAATG